MSKLNAWKNVSSELNIIFDKTGELKKLQEYTKRKYKKCLPKLDMQDTMEYISIINNRIEN